MDRYLAGSPALRVGQGFAGGQAVTLTVTGIGTVSVPSGLLGLGDAGYVDPGAVLRVPVPPGAYPVLVTRFDRTRANGSPWTVNATLSVVLNDLPEQRRGPLPTTGPTAGPAAEPTADPADPAAEPGGLDRVGVDGGVVAAFDWAAYEVLCAEDEEQFAEFFLTDMAARPTPWDHPLPGRPENLVADESGYGDGGYPVYGGFAADGRLTAVHVDFNTAASTPDRYPD